jgi:hypothetical protein
VARGKELQNGHPCVNVAFAQPCHRCLLWTSSVRSSSQAQKSFSPCTFRRHAFSTQNAWHSSTTHHRLRIELVRRIDAQRHLIIDNFGGLFFFNSLKGVTQGLVVLDR